MIPFIFTMSYRMFRVILKQYYNSFNVPVIKYHYKFLVSSASVINPSQKQSLNGTFEVAKHLKPLLDRPVNELLSDVDFKSITAAESVSILKALRMHTMFNQVSPKCFLMDSKFHLLCDIFQKNCNSLEFPLLISGLRSLLEVGMPADSVCVISAETQILNSCNKSGINAFSLIRCLHFFHKFAKTDLQLQVLTALKNELVRKLPGVSTPAEALLLSNVHHLFPETESKKIELKINEIVPLLNVHEMCKVILSLAQKSNRSISILSTIAFHMSQKQEFPGVNSLIDLLYAFKKLNYVDLRLFSFLMRKVTREVQFITQPSLISGILTTCGYLKWRQTDLLDECTDWIQVNFNKCRKREFVAYVLSTAALNYSTSKTNSLLKLLIPFLNRKYIDSCNILLNVAWSLAVLDNLPKDFLINILSPEFYKPLLDNPDLQTLTTNKLKLMNLKGILKIKYPENVFSCDLYLEPVKIKESSETENSRKQVIKVLSNFIPKDKCLSTYQCNDIGIFIDAEFIMSKSLKPLSLEEYLVEATTITKIIKPLPKGAIRCALLVMFHKDYTLKTRSLTGINVLIVKLLSHLGYAVVEISYDDFLRNKTEVQKAKYLMQRISNAMQNSEKNNVF